MLKEALRLIGGLQVRYANVIFVVAIVSTLFMALGVPKIRLQTDLSKELPQNIPVIELQEKVRDKFGDVDSFAIVVQVDSESQAFDRIADIRDPRVLRMIVDLHEKLSREKDVTTVFSLASFFRGRMPSSLEESRNTIQQIPQVGLLVNSDHSATVLYVNADVGAKEEDVTALTDAIGEDISNVAIPPGLKVSVTGSPVLRNTLLRLLVSDASFTIVLSALIILGLLLIRHRPVTRALLIFFPLATGIIWLLGTMGWIGLPLSIATVGIGAMILGLGVEYGVFIVTRYEEERESGKSQHDALATVMPGVGLAIFSSATTTIVGFLALLLASMPMIQHMGASLALGIVYSFIAAILVNPAFIVVEENFMERLRGR